MVANSLFLEELLRKLLGDSGHNRAGGREMVKLLLGGTAGLIFVSLPQFRDQHGCLHGGRDGP